MNSRLNFGERHFKSKFEEQGGRRQNFNDRNGRVNFHNRGLRDEASFLPRGYPTVQDRMGSEKDLRHIIGETSYGTPQFYEETSYGAPQFYRETSYGTPQFYKEASYGTPYIENGIRGLNSYDMERRGINFYNRDDRLGPSFHPSFPARRGHDMIPAPFNPRLHISERIGREQFFDNRDEREINFDKRDLRMFGSGLTGRTSFKGPPSKKKKISTQESTNSSDQTQAMSDKRIIENDFDSIKEEECQENAANMATKKELSKNGQKRHKLKEKRRLRELAVAQGLIQKKGKKRSSLPRELRGRYRCKKCKFSHNNKKAFIFHIYKIHEKNSIKCLKCTFVCTNMKLMLYHIAEFHLATLPTESAPEAEI